MSNEIVYMIMTTMMSSLGGLGLHYLLGSNSVFALLLSTAIAGIIAMLVMTSPQIDWRDRK